MPREKNVSEKKLHSNTPIIFGKLKKHKNPVKIRPIISPNVENKTNISNALRKIKKKQNNLSDCFPSLNFYSSSQIIKLSSIRLYEMI